MKTSYYMKINNIILNKIFNYGSSSNYLKFFIIKCQCQSWRTTCDCKTDLLWVRSPLEEMKYLPKFIFPFLRSGHVTQHVKPPEFGRKWGTECLNIRFPLPTLLCAGYSVKLVFDYISISSSWYRGVEFRYSTRNAS